MREHPGAADSHRRSPTVAPDALGRLLEERPEEVAHPDPRLGAKMLIEVIDAVLVERLTFSDTFLVPNKLSRAGSSTS